MGKSHQSPRFTPAVAPRPHSGIDVTSLVQYFCTQGLIQSTRGTYKSALCRFYDFCAQYSIVSPFPVSEAHSVLLQATQNLSPQTIKTYLAGVRHMQITLGLPEPQAFSSLPRLKLVQAEPMPRGLISLTSGCQSLQQF